MDFYFWRKSEFPEIGSFATKTRFAGIRIKNSKCGEIFSTVLPGIRMPLYKRNHISFQVHNTDHAHEMPSLVDVAQRNRTKIFLQKVFSPEYSLRIESEIFSKFFLKSDQYETKAREIRANINLRRNFVLYHKLISGVLSVAHIVALTSHEMAPVEKQKERASNHRDAMFEVSMTSKVRKFQRDSILSEDTCKKSKLWGPGEDNGNFEKE